MARKVRDTTLPAPFLKRVLLHPQLTERDEYPFRLPIFRNAFELKFDKAITMIVGENCTGKSTILEGASKMADFGDAGGGQGYRCVEHSRAIEASGGQWGLWLRAAWMPKIARGWFFRAETFFSDANYLDEVGSP